MGKTRHKRYQVFISSTFTDLRQVREDLAWSILGMRHIPVGMENFGAANDRGWETIEKTLRTTDYFVLLLAGRYGAIDDTVKMSWTEREYNYAIEHGIPVLAFLREASHITKADQDKDPKAAKRLPGFQKKVLSSRLVANWRESADLGAMVQRSLYQAISDDEETTNERPGWFRGDEIEGSPEVAMQLARLSKQNEELRAELQATKAKGDDVVLQVAPRLVFKSRNPDDVNGIMTNHVRDQWILYVAVGNVGSAAAGLVRVEFNVVVSHDLMTNRDVVVGDPSLSVRSLRKTQHGSKATIELTHLHAQARDDVASYTFVQKRMRTDKTATVRLHGRLLPANGPIVDFDETLALEPTAEQIALYEAGRSDRLGGH